MINFFYFFACNEIMTCIFFSLGPVLDCGSFLMHCAARITFTGKFIFISMYVTIHSDVCENSDVRCLQ